MREIAPQAAQTAQTGGFMAFHHNMDCLLRLMRRTIPDSGATPEGGVLAEQVFLGEGYELRLICRQGGARPFLACLERPWRHRVSLGRLDKDGRVRVFSYGLRLLYDVLAEGDVLDRFCLDLEKALELHLHCGGCAGTSGGPPPSPAGGRGGDPVH